MALLAGGLMVGAAPSASAASRTVPSHGLPAYTEQWSKSFSGVVANSSPISATIGGVRALVVGTRGGSVRAYSVAHGAAIKGWPATTPGDLPVDSTPSVSFSGSTIYVGVGNAGSPTGGGYLALATNGTRKWFKQVGRTSGSATKSGVSAGIAVGRLDGVDSVVAGSLGQYEDAFNSVSGATAKGFPWFSSDTEFSTPAIANIYGNGKNYIIGGAEQTAGTADGHTYKQGGHLRVLAATGNAGTGSPSGGTNCDFTPNQGVQSSPAVGHFLSGNSIGIVVGTGSDFKGASDTDKLFGLNSHCQVKWKASLDGLTTSSPALVDALGDGNLQVAEGTQGAKNGTVYLLNGTNGAVHWKTNVTGQVIGSITSAKLGESYQDLLVPTTDGLVILDGKTGKQLARLGAGQVALQNSPLVTKDADGDVGITIAGYNAKGGIILHYEFKGTDGGAVSSAGAWPMFHHDPQLTGTTLPRIT